MNATTITATAPVHAAVVVDIVVTTLSGSSAATAADQFTYPAPAPFISSLSPNSGPAGTMVTITGGYFTGAIGVSFGGSVAVPVVLNDSTMTVVAPLHPPLGTVDVQVTTPGGTSTPVAGSRYSYTAAPALNCGAPLPLPSPCTFNFASGSDGFTFTGLWHRETSAMGAPSLAYNSGCTGPLLQGCTFATGNLPNSGMAVSPLLNLGAARLLRFHTMRYPGDPYQCGIADRTRVFTSADGGASFQELPLIPAGAGIFPYSAGLAFGGFSGADLCGITNGTDLTSVAVVVPAGITNIAFSFDTVDGNNNNAAGWFITDVSLTVPVADAVDFFTSQFQWAPDSNLPVQPSVRLVTGPERALVTSDSGTLVTLGLEQPLGPSSTSTRSQQPPTRPKNAPPVFPDLKPATQPKTTKSLQPASTPPPGTLTCAGGTTATALFGIAQFQGCQVHSLGNYNWQITTPPTGSQVYAPNFLIETPYDCTASPCDLHVDSASEFPWLPGPSATSNWHIEPAASIAGMSGSTLAFNTGCTGPGLAGCDYNQPSSGFAATHLLVPTGATQLEFKVARDTGGACQQDDWLWAAYSLDGGMSWSYQALQQGSISPGGQYISQWGYICGNSTTAQTVRAPLPPGVTAVMFGFQTLGNFHGAGVFIDDVHIGAATATQLAFSQQPSGGATGIPFGTQPTVESQDGSGTHVYDNVTAVTLSLINPDGSPAGAPFACLGGNTRIMQSGYASFDGCNVTGIGTFRLRAVAGARQVDSNTFQVGVTLNCEQGQCNFNFSGSDYGFTFTGNLWHREMTAAPPDITRPTLAYTQGCIDQLGLLGCNTNTGHPNSGAAVSPRLNLGAARLLTFTSYLDTGGLCNGRTTLMYSTDGGANFRDLDIWPDGATNLLSGNGVMNAGGGHYCSFGGSFRASIILPAGTTNIAFQSTSSLGAGWFIDDITLTVPVAAQLWVQSPWGDWMPGVPFPAVRQPRVEVRTAEGALLTTDNTTAITLSFVVPPSSLSPTGATPGFHPVNGPHLTPQAGPIPAPSPAPSSTRIGGIGTASQSSGALTCDSLTVTVVAGVAKFSGCSVSQLGYGYGIGATVTSVGSPLTGLIFGGGSFNIVTPRACNGVGGCSFTFDSTLDFSFWAPSLWHRETSATVAGMSGGMLAYNTGCTGPGVAGCTFDLGGQEGPGFMVSPLLSMGSPSRLQFKVARDVGPFSICGQEDRLNASYSLDGGTMWWPIDFQALHATITPGGQYFSSNGWEGICGNSLTAQTVTVDLPAGVSNIIFQFDPMGTNDNAHAGIFIDDVHLFAPSHTSTTQRTVYRPSNGFWFPFGDGNGAWWGVPGDIPLPGDYDGDGVVDRAVFRPSNGFWYIVNSHDGSITSTWWGLSDDRPLQGDFDGDGKADLAVYRPSNGFWYIINSHDGSVTSTWWGMPGDIPVPADYDGDGHTDLAVYRPSNGYWYIINSLGSVYRATWWGVTGDVPVVGDYDGDGKADLAVYRPSNGYWYISRSSDSSMTSASWGVSGDLPQPGDYDGDGKTDIAVYRPSNGFWYVIRSSDGVIASDWWGVSGDIPLSLPFIIRDTYFP